MDGCRLLPSALCWSASAWNLWNFYEQLMNLFIAQIALGQRGVVRVSYSARFICMCAP